MRLSQLILLCFLSAYSYGTHVMGAYITYKHLSGEKYLLTFTFYRDCLGVPLGNPSSVSSLQCDSGGSAGLSLTLQSIEEVTPLSSGLSRCVPNNTYGTGVGIEKHVYVDTIDFDQAPYSAFKSCCEVIIQTGQCCRTSAINTGPSGNFYNYATLYRCNADSNSSPVLRYEPVENLCCNQATRIEMGAVDLVDHDSLSYHWGKPLTGYNQHTTYSGGYYDYNHPFQAYYPGTHTPPYNNPKSSPPVGIYLDPHYGDIIFTPTRCDEVTVAVIEIKEWRKDSNGTAQQVGIIRIDQEFITRDCPDNNPPEIIAQTEHETCIDQQICFDIETDDKVFVPPPPDSADAPDTVFLSWDHAIPGASFTIVNPDSLHQTARFCWTPDSSDLQNAPHVFTVRARDDHRPYYGEVSERFRIHIRYAEQPIVKERVACREFLLNADTNGLGSQHMFEWVLRDRNGNSLSDSAAYFINGAHQDVHTDSGYSARLFIDSLGIYSVILNIDDSASSCLGQVTSLVALDSADLEYFYSPVVINKDGWRLYTSDSTVVNWYRRDTLIGSGFEILAKGSGWYSARIVDSMGCTSNSSNLIYSSLHVPDIRALGLKIYPNPSKGRVVIDQSASDLKIISIRLFDLNGRELVTQINKIDTQIILNFDVTQGIYFLQLESDSGVFTERLEVVR